MNLQEKYNKVVAPAMMEKFGYKSVMAVPKIKKITVNIGFGKAVSGKGADETRKTHGVFTDDLKMITGQKPVLTKAKQAISGFKTRKGMTVGAMVTLRGKRMYDFLERLISIALPRSRDFQGIDAKSLDKKGNLSMGIREQIIFPEVSSENFRNIFGFEITISIDKSDKEKSFELLKLLGFPIKK